MNSIIVGNVKEKIEFLTRLSKKNENGFHSSYEKLIENSTSAEKIEIINNQISKIPQIEKQHLEEKKSTAVIKKIKELNEINLPLLIQEEIHEEITVKLNLSDKFEFTSLLKQLCPTNKLNEMKEIRPIKLDKFEKLVNSVCEHKHLNLILVNSNAIGNGNRPWFKDESLEEGTLKIVTEILPKLTVKIISSNSQKKIGNLQKILSNLKNSDWGKAISKNETIHKSFEEMIENLEKAMEPTLKFQTKNLERMKKNYREKEIIKIFPGDVKIIKLREQFQSLEKATKELKQEEFRDTHKLFYNIKTEVFEKKERNLKFYQRTGSSAESGETTRQAIDLMISCYRKKIMKDNLDYTNILKRLQNDLPQSQSVFNFYPQIKEQANELYQLIMKDVYEPTIENMNQLKAAFTNDVFSESIEKLFSIIGTDVFRNDERVQIKKENIQKAIVAFSEFTISYEEFKTDKNQEAPSIPGEHIGNLNKLTEAVILEASKILDPKYEKLQTEIAKIRKEVKLAFGNTAGMNPTPINWKRMQKLVISLSYLSEAFGKKE